MVRDEGRAEELTQDVFMKAWKHRHSFKPLVPVGGWLHRIAVNTAISHIRKSHYQLQTGGPRSGDEVTMKRVIESVPDSHSDIQEFEDKESFEGFVKTLSPNNARLCRMAFEQDLPTKEIEQKMNATTEAVLSRKSRVRKLAREYFRGLQ